MSSRKYGYFYDYQQAFRNRARDRVESILSSFQNELGAYKQICKDDKFRGQDKIFKKMCQRIFAQIHSKSINEQSFSISYKELKLKFTEIYLNMRKEVYNQSAFFVKQWQEKFHSMSDDIEPDDLRNLQKKLDRFSLSLFRKINTKTIEEIVDYIKQENIIINQALNEAKRRRLSLNKRLNELKDEISILFQEISEMNLEVNKSNKISSIKKDILKNAEVVNSKQYSDKSRKNIVQFEEKRAFLLKHYNEKLKELSHRDKILSNVNNHLEIPSINDFISKLTNSKKTEEKGKELSIQRDSLIKKILSLKNEIIKKGFPDYQDKVIDLTINIENESIEQLEMIKLEIGTILFQFEDLETKSQYFRKELYPLKLFMVQSENPEAKEISSTIEELLLKPSISEESFNEIVKNIDRMNEKEERITLLSDNLENFNKISKTMSEELDKLGYSTYREIKMDSEPIYLNTSQENYKLKITGNQQGEMLFKFIRVAGSLEEKESITDLQKQEDIKYCRNWFSDYKKLIGRLKEKGITFNEIWQKLPEDIGVDIEVNKSLIKRKKRRKRREEDQGLRKGKYN